MDSGLQRCSKKFRPPDLVLQSMGPLSRYMSRVLVHDLAMGRSGISSATSGCPSMSETVFLTKYFQWPQSKTGSSSGTFFFLSKHMHFTSFFHFYRTCFTIQVQPNKSTFQLSVLSGFGACNINEQSIFLVGNERPWRDKDPSRQSYLQNGEHS